MLIVVSPNRRLIMPTFGMFNTSDVKLTVLPDCVTVIVAVAFADPPNRGANQAPSHQTRHRSWLVRPVSRVLHREQLEMLLFDLEVLLITRTDDCDEELLVAPRAA